MNYYFRVLFQVFWILPSCSDGMVLLYLATEKEEPWYNIIDSNTEVNCRCHHFFPASFGTVNLIVPLERRLSAKHKSTSHLTPWRNDAMRMVFLN